MDMYFVGLDLAWGENNPSGIAVLDPEGRLVYLGDATDDDSIVAAVEPFVSGDCLVAIDAPLIVNNASGRRRAEAELAADFQRFDAGPHSANAGLPVFAGGPRGARIAEALRLDMDPTSQSMRRAIEVYPHPAIVVFFELDLILKYKKGDVGVRRSELLRLMDLIESLANSTPQLRVRHLPTWAELRNIVAAATKQVHLQRAEDPVDAVVCAYVALYSYARPEDVTMYGDVANGYIITPTLPADLTPRVRATAAPPEERQTKEQLARRLTRAEAVLAELQRELAEIRRRLDG
jgi:predicted RNase H-like nuclease